MEDRRSVEAIETARMRAADAFGHAQGVPGSISTSAKLMELGKQIRLLRVTRGEETVASRVAEVLALSSALSLNPRKTRDCDDEFTAPVDSSVASLARTPFASMEVSMEVLSYLTAEFAMSVVGRVCRTLRRVVRVTPSPVGSRKRTHFDSTEMLLSLYDHCMSIASVSVCGINCAAFAFCVFPSITHISLRIDEPWVWRFFDVACNTLAGIPSLTAIEISQGAELHVGHARLLAKLLKKCRNIESLSLAVRDIPLDAATKIGAIASKSKQLRKLKLFLVVHSEGVLRRIFEGIGRGNRLERLTVRCCGLTEDEILSLGRALSGLSTLRSLNLNNCGLKDENISRITLSLPRMLRSLHLSGNVIGSRGFRSLCAALPRCPELTALDISYNHLLPVDIASLDTDLLSCLALIKLDVSYNAVGNSGAISLARSLSNIPRGIRVDLQWNGLDDVGCLRVVEILSLSRDDSVREIELSGARIHSQTASSIRDICASATGLHINLPPPETWDRSRYAMCRRSFRSLFCCKSAGAEVP